MMTQRRIFIALPLLCLALSGVQAQVAVVRGRVEVEDVEKTRHGAIPGTVVWLSPVPGAESSPLLKPSANAILVQKNKSFEPHILVIPAGTAVEFPNRDPFF